MSNLLQRRGAPAVVLPEARPTPLRSVWQSTLGALARWVEDQRAKRGSIARLQHLNDWMLRDIGIDRDDIEDSADRRLWELRLHQETLIARDFHRGL
jgi:uncharacterized protein YjiS (DUF1127 family)